MASFHKRLTQKLDGYAGYVREEALVQPKHQPYLVRWMVDFMRFAWDHGGDTFEQTLELFLGEIGERVRTQLWQVQQVAAAIAFTDCHSMARLIIATALARLLA